METEQYDIIFIIKKKCNLLNSWIKLLHDYSNIKIFVINKGDNSTILQKEMIDIVDPLVISWLYVKTLREALEYINKSFTYNYTFVIDSDVWLNIKRFMIEYQEIRYKNYDFYGTSKDNNFTAYLLSNKAVKLFIYFLLMNFIKSI